MEKTIKAYKQAKEIIRKLSDWDDPKHDLVAGRISVAQLEEIMLFIAYQEGHHVV